MELEDIEGGHAGKGSEVDHSGILLRRVLGTTGGKVSGEGLKRSSQWEKVALVVQIILQIWLAAA